MSFWEDLKKAGSTYMELKIYESYHDVWYSIKKNRFDEALEGLKSVPEKRSYSSDDDKLTGYPRIELSTTKGYIYFGLKKYEEAVDALEGPVSWAEDDLLENTPNSPIRLKEMIPDLYYKYGIALWKTGKIKDAVNALTDAYNYKKDNLWYIIKIILIYAQEGNLFSVDFYTENLCQCYNSKYSVHREQMHEYLQKDDLWNNYPRAYERFLRKLRENKIIDSHFLHSKIGQEDNQNGIDQGEKSKLLKALIKDEITKVLEQLTLICSDKPDLFNQIIMLYNNYNKTQMEIRNGVISKSDEILHLNKIKLSIIKLINDL